MKLVSVQVGLPRELEWRGRRVRTSIWKTPVVGRVRVARTNLEGDRQSDRSVHGGLEKAVYAYPSEHYPAWIRELEVAELPWGSFGENFTTSGLLETEVRIGDRLRAGSAEFVVTQPRMPCYKLAVRFDREDMTQRFLESGRSGFYLAVSREGEVGAGDPIEHLVGDRSSLTVAQIRALHTGEISDRTLLERAAALPSLPEAWRALFRRRLGVQEGSPSARPGSA